MALDDLGEGMEGAGWLGAAVATVILAPVMVRGLRPVTKRMIKGYLTLSDRMRGLMMETGERWQDLMAEAKAEYASRGAGAAVAPAPATTAPQGEGSATPEPAMRMQEPSPARAGAAEASPELQQALERGHQLVLRQRALIHPERAA